MWTLASAYEEARGDSLKSGDQIRKMADLIMSRYRGWMPGRSETEIADILNQSTAERLAAVPDLRKYPELRGMRELIQAGWRGVRDGAGLNDRQWAVHCNGLFYYRRHLASLQRPPSECSYVFFPHSDHGPILANNLDSSPDEPFGPPVWPAQNEHLIVGGVSSGMFFDEVSPEIFPAPMFKLLARYCRSTDEAVEMLTRYNLFWGPQNLIVIDRHNDVAMIEKSACRIGVRKSRDGFGFITACTAEEPGMKAYLADRRAYSLKARKLPAECPDTIYWGIAEKRRNLMNQLLDEARANPTLEKLRQIIQFRDPKRGQVCYNGEELYPGGTPLEFTLRTQIWLLREGRALWWAKEGQTPSYENRKEDVVFKDVFLWD
jgi:hypothetical protein